MQIFFQNKTCPLSLQFLPPSSKGPGSSHFTPSTPRPPPLLLISQYSSIIIISLRNENPTPLSALLLPNNDPFKSPPEFPKLPNHQPLPNVPLEVLQISPTPGIDPANPPPYGPDPVPVPGPEFPKPSIPPQPDPGPELPKPPIPPRPDTLRDPGLELPIPPLPDPDIPLPKPDVVPPDYVPRATMAGDSASAISSTDWALCFVGAR